MTPYRLTFIDPKLKVNASQGYVYLYQVYMALLDFMERELTPREYTDLNTSGVIGLAKDLSPVANHLEGHITITLVRDDKPLIDGYLVTMESYKGGENV